MKYSKKYFGNTVHVILKTVTETYCVMGDDTIKDIVKMLNTAHIVSVMWDLQEIDSIESYVNDFNKILQSDDSKYQIIKSNNEYRLLNYIDM